MNSKDRFHLEGLMDGFVSITVVDRGVKHQVKVTPRKLLGIVAQLSKIDDKHAQTVSMPVDGTFAQFKLSRIEAQQLASEIADLMKWQK